MKPNIILIVVDTLRRDAIQPYNKRSKTPNINNLSKDSNVLKNAISPSPWTLPSHASLFTGLYPTEHKVRNLPDMDISTNFFKMRELLRENKSILLAEELRKRGYNTVAAVANPILSPESGFDEGFDVYMQINYAGVNDRYKIDEVRKRYGNLELGILPRILLDGNVSYLADVLKYFYGTWDNYKRSGQPLIKGGTSILDLILNSSFEQPFFLFLNLMEMHEPYLKSDFLRDVINRNVDTNILDAAGVKNFRQSLIKKYNKAYFEEAGFLDSIIAKLISHLKASGVYDNTLIVLTSDHGQALREKNFFGHGTFLYDEIIKIPMIIKLPENKKIKIREGYQSLASLKDFILHQVDNGGTEDTITEERVFSEENRKKIFLTPNLARFEDIISETLASRRCVFRNGFKLSVNGEEGSIEEFTLNGSTVTESEYPQEFNDLLYELEIFKGNDNLKLPREV